MLARARRRARRRARAQRRSRCSSAYAERLAAPQRIFFNIDVDSLVIGFAVAGRLRQRAGVRVRAGAAKLAGRSRVGHQRGRSPRGAARGRLRAGLVVAQVAVSLLLLVGAGLVTRSLEAARRATSGLRREPRDGDRDGPQAERLRRGARPRVLSPAARRRRAPMPAPSRRRSRRSSRWRFSTRRRGASRSKATSRARRGSRVPVEHRRARLLPHAADPLARRPRVRGPRR